MKLVKALNAAHPDEKYKLYDFNREKFSLEMAVNEFTDPRLSGRPSGHSAG